MPDNQGPWRRDQPIAPRPAIPRHRFVLWLVFMAMVGGGIWMLSRLYPGQDGKDWMWVLRGAVLMGIVSTALLRPRPIRWGEKARHAAIWVGIVAVLVVGVAYRDVFEDLGQRVRSEFASSYPVASGARELVVTQAADGSFYVMGQVNGQPVPFLIDTGASDTVLSPADAQRVGVNAASLSFDHMAETANGTGYGARFVADSVAVGPIRFDQFAMTVNQAPMTSSLLGLTFLQRLESFRVSGRRLYLTARR